MFIGQSAQKGLCMYGVDACNTYIHDPIPKMMTHLTIDEWCHIQWSTCTIRIQTWIKRNMLLNVIFIDIEHTLIKCNHCIYQIILLSLRTHQYWYQNQRDESLISIHKLYHKLNSLQLRDCMVDPQVQVLSWVRVPFEFLFSLFMLQTKSLSFTLQTRSSSLVRTLIVVLSEPGERPVGGPLLVLWL